MPGRHKKKEDIDLAASDEAGEEAESENETDDTEEDQDPVLRGNSEF